VRLLNVFIQRFSANGANWQPSELHNPFKIRYMIFAVYQPKPIVATSKNWKMRKGNIIGEGMKRGKKREEYKRSIMLQEHTIGPELKRRKNTPRSSPEFR